MNKIVKDNKFISIKKIYLFGSYAKGTNDEFSDVDLLIIFENEIEAIVICPIIKDLLKKSFDMDSDIIPAIENHLDEFDRYVSNYGKEIYNN